MIQRINQVKCFIILTLNLKPNTTGKSHGVIGYDPYYFRQRDDIGKYFYDEENKEYILKNNPDDDGNIFLYKQGVVITDDFKAYIGKVQLDDGTIIDIPPLLFKKNVYVESYNPVTDTINAGARTKRLFNGTVEDYKKQKK